MRDRTYRAAVRKDLSASWKLTVLLIRQTATTFILAAPLTLVFAPWPFKALGILYAAGYVSVMLLPSAVEVFLVVDLLNILIGLPGRLLPYLSKVPGPDPAKSARLADSIESSPSARILSFVWAGTPTQMLSTPVVALVSIVRRDALATYVVDLQEAVQSRRVGGVMGLPAPEEAVRIEARRIRVRLSAFDPSMCVPA